MAFSDEDKHIIKYLHQSKRYGSVCLLKEFPNKSWTRGGLDKLLKKIDSLDTVSRIRAEVGRGPLDQRTIDNAVVEWLLHLTACVNAHGGHFEFTL